MSETKKPRRSPTTDQIIQALQLSGGLVSVAAQKLGITRQTLHEWMRDDPEIQAARADIREQTLDLAEGQLLKLVKEGDRPAVIFYLETMGRDRGFTKRRELAGPDGGPLQIEGGEPALDLTKLSTEELRSYRDLLAKAQRSADAAETAG